MLCDLDIKNKNGHIEVFDKQIKGKRLFTADNMPEVFREIEVINYDKEQRDTFGKQRERNMPC